MRLKPVLLKPHSSQVIKGLVDQYQLEIGGIQFWTPYWRDEIPSTANQHPLTGPYKGKGTPSQLRGYLEQNLGKEVERSSDGLRLHMRELHLGVDCSGFAYFVLAGYLQETQGKELADYLYKPRQVMIEDFHNPVYKHPPHITLELLENLPEQVPLSKIQEFWGNDPVRLAGVFILGSEAATVPVEDYTQLRTGDLVVFRGADGIMHCLVVVDNDGRVITYAHSGRSKPEHLGGVEYRQIEIVEPDSPIYAQKWEGAAPKLEQFADQPLRRLKALTD
jgi:hypothetical protein